MIKWLTSITPKWIKKKAFYTVLPILKDERIKQSGEIPRTNLESKHLKNALFLEDRVKMLSYLPKNAVVAELGVDKGDFSKSILDTTQPSKLHLVDLWNTERYHEGKKLHVQKRFENEINSNQVEVNIGLSTSVVDQFPDQYFDWIYIDTDHSYSTTASELQKYKSKMKKNGIICGHDYKLGNWDGMVRYGVIEAVAEFCVRENWELLFVTTELTIHPSFAIRAIEG